MFSAWRNRLTTGYNSVDPSQKARTCRINGIWADLHVRTGIYQSKESGIFHIILHCGCNYQSLWSKAGLHVLW